MNKSKSIIDTVDELYADMQSGEREEFPKHIQNSIDKQAKTSGHKFLIDRGYKPLHNYSEPRTSYTHPTMPHVKIRVNHDDTKKWNVITSSNNHETASAESAHDYIKNNLEK